MDSSPPRPRPTIGLDAPCRQCGQPIYFNYRGPIEGVCGKCTDRMRRTARGNNGSRWIRAGRTRSRGWLGLVIVLAVAALAVGAYLVYSLLNL